MAQQDYDFDFLDALIDVDLDPRTNLRISKCCYNCKYYYCARNKPRRGFCKLPLNKYMGTYRYEGDNYEEVEKITPWLRVHCTNVCDMHANKSFTASTRRVIEWTGINFNSRGDSEVMEDV